MPYRKIRHADGSYSVVNAETGEVHAKRTSESKADAQLRILHAYDAGDPVGERKKPVRRKR